MELCIENLHLEDAFLGDTSLTKAPVDFVHIRDSHVTLEYLISTVLKVLRSFHVALEDKKKRYITIVKKLQVDYHRSKKPHVNISLLFI